MIILPLIWLFLSLNLVCIYIYIYEILQISSVFGQAFINSSYFGFPRNTLFAFGLCLKTVQSSVNCLIPLYSSFGVSLTCVIRHFFPIFVCLWEFLVLSVCILLTWPNIVSRPVYSIWKRSHIILCSLFKWLRCNMLPQNFEACFNSCFIMNCNIDLSKTSRIQKNQSEIW